MQRARARPPEPNDADRDQIVVMRGTWELYQTLLDARGERRHPRLAYLDGEVEIMTTSGRHEITKTMLARLLEAYVDVRELSLNGIGGKTLRKQLKKAGLEPDECYCIGGMSEFPDLAIEVVETHGGIDKLEIYRRLGVGEVWFWIDGAIWVYRLISDKFQWADASGLFPELDLHELARAVLRTDDGKQAEAVREFRKSLGPRPRRRAIRTRNR